MFNLYAFRIHAQIERVKRFERFMVKFAERLRELRKEKGITQQEMANFLKIKHRSYQNYEGGDRRPDYEGLVALADYFGVTTDYLLGRSDLRG